ncbi:MAG TPA: hypothetical protein VE994_03060 [Terriglobales bacterium]|nr:hypothetical protein [Terriglobales bacterium]
MNYFWIVLVFAITMLPLRAYAATDPLHITLARVIPHYSSHADNFLEALTELASREQIPMGIEWTETPQTLAPVSVKLENTTVEKLVQSIIGTQPGMTMSIENGIVHILPVDSEKRKDDFLNIKIDNFEAQNEYVAVASYRLRTKINSIITPPPPFILGQPKPGRAGHVSGGAGDRLVSFHLKNVSVREALDELLRLADFKVWVVTFPAKLTLTGAGYAKSISLWTYREVPDMQQPVWELLVWGMDPTSGNLREDWYERSLTPDARASSSHDARK